MNKFSDSLKSYINKIRVKPIFLVSSLFLFIASLLAPLYFVGHADAAVDPSQYKYIEAYYVLNKDCLNGKDSKNFWGTVSKANAEAAKVFNDNSEDKKNVSNILDPKDNQRQCNSLLTMVAQGIGLSWNEFFTKFYTPLDDNNDGNFDDYTFKSGVTSDTIEAFIDKEAGDKGWILSGVDKAPLPYIAAAVKPKFDKCFKPSDSGLDYAFTIDGKKYSYEGSKTDKHVVGGIVDWGNDGYWGCDEMGKKFEDSSPFAGGFSLAEIVLGSAADKEKDALNQDAKKVAIKKVFDANKDILRVCVAQASTGLAALPIETQIGVVTGWLAAGGTGDMRYVNASGNDASVQSTDATTMLGCLNANYPGLADATKTELPFPDPNGGSDGASNNKSCESEGGEMSWIICPLLRIADNFVEVLDRQINNLLVLPPDYLDGIKEGWSNMRNIAYLIIIPVTLVMVISTALGFEFISAYTVKRALPRLVFAVIFIALSFSICKFLIDVTNGIGNGIYGLIVGSVAGNSATDGTITLASLFDPGALNGGLFSVGLLLGGLGVAAVGSIGILLSYVLVTVIALVIGFLTLALRQFMIITFVMFAPLAIIAWIFPGNDKLWKLWWGSFSKLLLMFPLVMILIASGKSFATIIQDTSNGPLETLLKLIAYIAPYFFIPATFKFAGGAFATISGMANDKSRGIFDRNKKYRGAKAKQNWQDTKGGNRFKGNNALSRRASSAMGYASNVNRAGLNPAHMRRNMQAALAERDLIGMQENMEKNAAFKPFIGNDDLLAAATHGNGTEADARAYLQGRGQTGRDLEQNLAHIAAAKRSMGGRQFAMAAAVANAGTGTGYAGGPGEMLEAIQRASGGDMTLAGNMLAAAKSKAEGSRRYDLSGAGFGDMYGQLQAINRAQNPAAHAAAVQHATDHLTDRALDANGPGAMLGGRGRSVENLIPAMQRRVQASQDALFAARRGGTPEDIETADRNFRQTLASTAGLLDVASQVSPENARMLADGLMSAEIRDDTNRVQGTLLEHIEANRGNQEFNEMRREYGAQAQQQHQAAMNAATNSPGQIPPIIPPA